MKRRGYDGYGYGAHHNVKRQRTERPPRLIRNYGDMATFAEQWNGAETRLRVEDRTIYTIRWQDSFVHVTDMATRALSVGERDHRVRAMLMLAFAMDRRQQQPLRVRMPRLYPLPAVGAPEPHAAFLNAWGFQWSPKCDDHKKMLMGELVTDFLHTCWMNKDKYRARVARYLTQTQPVQLQPQPVSGKRPSPSAQGPAGKRAHT